MVGTYNGWLVVLSVVVAILASYVALDLASRVTASQARQVERYWLIGGATSMGERHLVDAFRRHAGVPFTDPDVV